jgi:PAS domain S-box-containing protein
VSSNVSSKNTAPAKVKAKPAKPGMSPASPGDARSRRSRAQPGEPRPHAGEDLLRVLFDSSLDAVLLVSLDGDILAANPAAQALFQHSEEELRRAGWRHLIDTKDPRFREALIQHQNTGRYSGELRFFDSRGQEFPGELSSSGLTGKDGQRLTSIIVRDISRRRQIEIRLIASEERYAALFRDASDPIVIADERGRVEEANSSFAALLGYQTSELPGLSVDSIHPAHEMDRIRLSFYEIFRTGHIAPVETSILRKDGSLVEVEIRPTLIEIGGRTVVQGIFIDLTERKRLEQKRIDEERAHRETLVREVHHRIKNNLQSVAGLLQRELGRYVELNPRLETAISQVHAIAVVHGLQSSNPDEAVRLCDSVSNICRTVSDLSQRPVLFHIEHEHTAFTPVRIESSESVPVALMLNELILNAVKHSPENGCAPTVALQADGTAARITIRNPINAAPEFNIETGQGLGTGLRLVRSLLPVNGARLSYALDDEGLVVTKLLLSAPVVGRILPKVSR